MALQTEVDVLTTGEAERLLIHSCSRYYKHCEKYGRLLAHWMHCQASSRLLPRIADGSGVLPEDLKTINSVLFFSFYELRSSSDP